MRDSVYLCLPVCGSYGVVICRLESVSISVVKKKKKLNDDLSIHILLVWSQGFPTSPPTGNSLALLLKCQGYRYVLPHPDVLLTLTTTYFLL